VRRIDEGWAEVLLPWEVLADFEAGKRFALLDKAGAFLEEAELLGKTFHKKRKTWVLSFKVSLANAARAAGIRVQAEAATACLPEPRFGYLPDDAILCRCERISVGEIRDYIGKNDIRDLNQLKSLRVAMGACGSKTCSVLLPQLFRSMGRDPKTLSPLSQRPLSMEVPMGDLVNEGKQI
jgi:NAD(P)H-nitrite reductase large subunit